MAVLQFGFGGVDVIRITFRCEPFPLFPRSGNSR
jgi:hypothetical protein